MLESEPGRHFNGRSALSAELPLTFVALIPWGALRTVPAPGKVQVPLDDAETKSEDRQVDVRRSAGAYDRIKIEVDVA